jgi:hypothetical protein
MFALPHSDLNPFLRAEIGVEAGGMAVSVLTMLARCDVDPWREAGRLARLPRATAAGALARLIADSCQGVWPMPDAMVVALRLVNLLPGRDAGAAFPAPPALGAASRLDGSSILALLVIAAIVAAETWSLSEGWRAGSSKEVAQADCTSTASLRSAADNTPIQLAAACK